MPSYGQYHTAQPAGLNLSWLSQSQKASWGIQELLSLHNSKLISPYLVCQDYIEQVNIHVHINDINNCGDIFYVICNKCQLAIFMNFMSCCGSFLRVLCYPVGWFGCERIKSTCIVIVTAFVKLSQDFMNYGHLIIVCIPKEPRMS